MLLCALYLRSLLLVRLPLTLACLLIITRLPCVRVFRSELEAALRAQQSAMGAVLLSFMTQTVRVSKAARRASIKQRTLVASVLSFMSVRARASQLHAHDSLHDHPPSEEGPHPLDPYGAIETSSLCHLCTGDDSECQPSPDAGGCAAGPLGCLR